MIFGGKYLVQGTELYETFDVLSLGSLVRIDSLSQLRDILQGGTEISVPRM